MVSENHPPRDQQVFAALPKMHQQQESSGTTEFVAVPQHAYTISEPYPVTSHLPSGQQPVQPQRRHDKHPHPHPKCQDQHHHHHHHHPNPKSPYSHHQNHHPGHGHDESPSHNSDPLPQHHQVSANALAVKLGNLENHQQLSRTQNTEKMDPGSHQPTRPPAKVLASKAHYDPSISSSSPSSTSAVSSTSTQLSDLQQRGEKVLNSILERLDQNSADLMMAPSDDSASWTNSNTPGVEGTRETSGERSQRRISPVLLKDQQRNLQQHHGSANLRHS